METKHDTKGLTIYYTDNNVFDAAKARINRIYDEFDDVVVAMSGGKDSTVVFELAYQVAKERNRLPVKLLFIDQEAEWQCAIDYIRTLMLREGVEPLWYQFPMRIFNATSFTDHWLNCWEVGKEDVWMRKKEDFSIHTVPEIDPTTPFNDVFTRLIEVLFAGKKVAMLGGLRAEENPKRRAGLTTGACYKEITWGKKLSNKKNAEHYTFYPLYDWSYTDIWKAIHDHKWGYCKLYDYQYRDGVSIPAMRVSNLHHETALNSLDYLATIERGTWIALTKRLEGINSYKHLKVSYNVPDKLPYMFKDWFEYRAFLVEKLIVQEKKAIYEKQFASDEKFAKQFSLNEHQIKDIVRTEIRAVLLNDYYFTTLNNFLNRVRLLNR